MRACGQGNMCAQVLTFEDLRNLCAPNGPSPRLSTVERWARSQDNHRRSECRVGSARGNRRRTVSNRSYLMHLGHVPLLASAGMVRPGHGSLAGTHNLTCKPTWLTRHAVRICGGGSWSHSLARVHPKWQGSLGWVGANAPVLLCLLGAT
jgi:hypothetical protein